MKFPGFDNKRVLWNLPQMCLWEFLELILEGFSVEYLSTISSIYLKWLICDFLLIDNAFVIISQIKQQRAKNHPDMR